MVLGILKESAPGETRVALLPGSLKSLIAQGVSVTVDLDLYRDSGLPATTMGRGIDHDELFFRSALAGGAVLAEEIDVVRAGGN